MIYRNNQIRLTEHERGQLRWLTGTDVSQIKPRQELEGFIDAQLRRQRCNGPGACLARRVLASYLSG